MGFRARGRHNLGGAAYIHGGEGRPYINADNNRLRYLFIKEMQSSFM